MTDAVVKDPAVTETPAAPASDPAAAPPATESLVHGGAPAAAAEAAPADGFAFAEKVLVKGADGAEDWKATAMKAEQARQHLEKRMGSGDVPPKDVAGYEFKVPDELQGFEIAGERVDAFKAEALTHGITPAQFAWMMDSYLKAAPDLMGGVVKMQASQARDELAKTWATSDAMTQNLQASQRAVSTMPKDLQDATLELGTHPGFIKAMAYWGAQIGEDRGPGTTVAAPAADVSALQMSEAYRNPRHPDHARVSKQVADHFARRFGTQPV